MAEPAGHVRVLGSIRVRHLVVHVAVILGHAVACTRMWEWAREGQITTSKYSQEYCAQHAHAERQGKIKNPATALWIKNRSPEMYDLVARYVFRAARPLSEDRSLNWEAMVCSG